MNKSISETIIKQIEDAKPEDGTRRQQLWVCNGKDISAQKPFLSFFKKTNGNFWVTLSYSKEDAEANAAAARPCDCWEWDGEPAQVITLGEAMDIARRKNRLGVAIQSYRNGQWVAVATHSVGAPLPE